MADVNAFLLFTTVVETVAIVAFVAFILIESWRDRKIMARSYQKSPMNTQSKPPHPHEVPTPPRYQDPRHFGQKTILTPEIDQTGPTGVVTVIANVHFVEVGEISGDNPRYSIVAIDQEDS